MKDTDILPKCLTSVIYAVKKKSDKILLEVILKIASIDNNNVKLFVTIIASWLVEIMVRYMRLVG